MSVQREWDGDHQLEALVMERTMLPEDTPYSIGCKDLRAYFPAAVRSIAQLSLYATRENIRLEASKFIVTKAMELEVQTAADPLVRFFDEVTEFAETNEGKVE
jgi:hypothetical protein